MTDRVSIDDLRVQTRIGVTEDERAKPQYVRISVQIDADLSTAAHSDDIDHTIDYHRAIREIAALAERTECRLLEHLAARVADLAGGYEGAEGVRVRIVKEDPPMSEDVGEVSVEIARGSG